jgi:hypothetical protein
VFKALSRKGLERIKNVWGTQRVWDGTDIRHWLQHPLVQERIKVWIFPMTRWLLRQKRRALQDTIT